jgi:hypothetical protein
MPRPPAALHRSDAPTCRPGFAMTSRVVTDVPDATRSAPHRAATEQAGGCRIDDDIVGILTPFIRRRAPDPCRHTTCQLDGARGAVGNHQLLRLARQQWRYCAACSAARAQQQQPLAGQRHCAVVGEVAHQAYAIGILAEDFPACRQRQSIHRACLLRVRSMRTTERVACAPCDVQGRPPSRKKRCSAAAKSSAHVDGR